MHIWFWAWLLLAAILAVMGFFDRRFTLPWAFGAGAAALLEALGAPIGWQWVALIAIPSVLVVGGERFRAPGRKSLRSRGGRGRAGARTAEPVGPKDAPESEPLRRVRR